MSHPIDFFQSNMVVKGEHLSTPEQKVGDLPVYREDHDGGGATYWSCWQLSEEEIASIQEFKCVFVGFVNPNSIPPTCVAAPVDIYQSGDGQ